MATHTDLREVWLVVSPHNPLKDKKSLAKDYDRLHLVHLAVQDNPALRPCDIEFSLPKPSFTIDTLAYLKEKYPERRFCLIMGSDNLATLHKWKNHELLLRDYPLYVYHRPEYPPGSLAAHPCVRIFEDVPLMMLSSSYIRQCIQAGKSVRYLVSDPVFEYLASSGMYR
ncbi:MAG: nicotinate (nicotinamide) nucleotide adenylyltransferase, partial [Haliscomenobacter sp.]